MRLPLVALMVLGAPAFASGSSGGSDEVSWYPLQWSVEGMALGGRTPLAGMGVSIGRPLGTMSPELTETVTGWVVVPGVDLSVSRLFGPACEPPERNCEINAFAFRLASGPSFKIGYAEGFVDRASNTARASLLVSLTLSAMAALHRIDAAPLVPSSTFTDLIIRGRLGVMHPSHVFSLSILLEGVLFNPLTRGVNVGLGVGVCL